MEIVVGKIVKKQSNVATLFLRTREEKADRKSSSQSKMNDIYIYKMEIKYAETLKVINFRNT